MYSALIPGSHYLWNIFDTEESTYGRILWKHMLNSNIE